MGATYTRQSSSNIVDGNVIEASDINNEFNQLLAAFVASSGHTHDGTSAEGGAITKLLGTAITIGDATSGTDIAVTFDGESNDGVLTWMEDEDYFQFSDDLLLSTTEKLQFRDTAIYINSSADGQLDLVADTEIQIAATTIDINGAVALDGAITGATNITLSGELDAATLDISGDADIDGTLETDALSINGTAITSTAAEINILDGDNSASSVTIADADRIILNDGGTMKQVAVTALNTYTSASIAADDIGTGDAAVTIATSSGNITIDAQAGDADIIFKGTDSSSDITALTLDMSEAGAATFNNKIVATELDISGDVDIDGTLEADAITIDGTTLAETISDTVGAMVGSNTETGISVTYEDGDNTLDFVLGSSQTAISSLTNTSLVIGRDADNDIDFATDNTILFRTDGADQIKLINGALAPVTDDDIDLGTNSLEFKDGYFDGTVTADAFAGPLTGDVTGNVSGTAATVTTAAQSNITSLGTLTTLTVDNVIINGTTIGHTSDTDLITLADGIATVAGEISVTTLDIGGTNVAATAAELNIMDGGTAASSTTLADADRMVINDNGTMKQVAVTDMTTYINSNASFASKGFATAMAIAL
jgi:cytoskeletal protein CcmA (bactofilin family)